MTLANLTRVREEMNPSLNLYRSDDRFQCVAVLRHLDLLSTQSRHWQITMSSPPTSSLTQLAADVGPNVLRHSKEIDAAAPHELVHPVDSNSGGHGGRIIE